MKRAKVTLCVITVLAITGGVFAFKANKFIPPNVYSSYLTTVNGQPTILCKLTVKFFSTTGIPGTYYRSTRSGSICTGTTITFVTEPDI